MVNLFKQLEELVIRWKFKLRRDEFFVTRIRLTILYTVLSVIFLVAFSYVIYGSLTSRLAESAQETILDKNVRDIVLTKASIIIQNLIFLGDSIVLVVVLFVGFFLTKKTLEPIQTMVKKQERFIADASHELRTPLAVMKTGIEVSLRRKDLSAEIAREILTDTLKEVNILTTLSNDLLSLSKVHLSDIKFEKIYLPSILESKKDRMKHIIKEKNINLILCGNAEKDKYILGNEFMIRQIFYNLIHNAIVYTNNNGTIKINYSIPKRGNYYVVNIIDEGIGIPKEILPHIFEPFYRADNAHSTNGSGLGLSIVKSHVDLHHGKIDIKSELGKGTTVTVRLPLAPQS